VSNGNVRRESDRRVAAFPHPDLSPVGIGWRSVRRRVASFASSRLFDAPDATLSHRHPSGEGQLRVADPGDDQEFPWVKRAGIPIDEMTKST
jgi:hypothetical protein